MSWHCRVMVFPGFNPRHSLKSHSALHYEKRRGSRTTQLWKAVTRLAHVGSLPSPSQTLNCHRESHDLSSHDLMDGKGL